MTPENQYNKTNETHVDAESLINHIGLPISKATAFSLEKCPSPHCANSSFWLYRYDVNGSVPSYGCPFLDCKHHSPSNTGVPIHSLVVDLEEIEKGRFLKVGDERSKRTAPTNPQRIARAARKH